MIFQYQKNAKTIELLNDLVRIHNDRIAGYTYALEQPNLEMGLCNAFEEIISDSKYYQEQLTDKIKELHADPLKGSTMLGKIYRAWMVLKVTFPGSTQKAIISSCLYNEEIALHAYNAALSSKVDMGKEIQQLVEKQEYELRKIYTMISKYRETSLVPEQRLTYFI